MSIAIVTTVTTSYLPLARVLMESVARIHPEATRVVLVLDGEIGAEEHFEVIRPADVIDDPAEVRILEAIYKPIELATCFKPALLKKYLLTHDQVFFLDPDMRLFQPLTSAQEALTSGTGTLLTPHRLTAPGTEDAAFFEWAIRMYGVYNTGFAAVTDRSLPFLDWWGARLHRDCIDDLENGHWVDQRIVDLAPGYFEVDIFRDPAYNVGWWNFIERPLRQKEGVWYAGETPLVLMHYSGVRPAKPKGELPQLAHSPRNPIVHDAAMLAAITRLEDEYIADLFANGYSEYSKLPYPFATTAAGNRLTEAARLAYRAAVIDAEQHGRPVPDPDDLPWDRLTRVRRRARRLKVVRAAVVDARSFPRLQGAVDRLESRLRPGV